MAIRQLYLAKEQTAAGAGSPRRWDMPSGTLTVEILITVDAGSTLTACTVDLEASITNINYFALASHTLTATEITAKAAMFHVVDKPAKLIRSNIKTLTVEGGGSAHVSIIVLSTDR